MTVDLGTNQIAGTDPARILALALQRLDDIDGRRPSSALSPQAGEGWQAQCGTPLPLAGEDGGEGQPNVEVRRPPLWDGHTATRIVSRLAEDLLR